MKPLVLISTLFLFAGLIYATPAGTPLPEFKSITPKVEDAPKVSQEDICSVKHSPAKAQTKLAMEGFRTGVLYMFASLINAEPTHAELSQAANWQMDQTIEILKQAQAMNKLDTKSPLRKKWFSIRLKWLHFKIKVAKGIIGFGIPSWPWLGDIVNKVKESKIFKWLQTQTAKLKEKFESLKTYIKSWFGGSTPETPATPATPATPETPATPAAPAGGAAPATVPIQDTIVRTGPGPLDATIDKAKLAEAIEKEVPAAGQEDAAVKAKLDKSIFNKNNIPKRSLMKAHVQPLDDAFVAKLQKQIETEIAKTDIIIEQLDTAKVC